MHHSGDSVMTRFRRSCAAVTVLGCLVVPEAAADDVVGGSPAKMKALSVVDMHRDQLVELNQAVWKFAELGLEERKSAQAIITVLEEAGFDVQKGIADMPTAFVASFGSGKPVIGILAEYDALPGLSQDAVAEQRPIEEGAAGHACGHSGLGTAAVG